MSARNCASSKPFIGLPSAMSPSAMAGMSISLDGVDQAQEVHPLRAVQLPDEPHVEEHEALGRGVGHQVARVGVAVEEPVDEHLLDDGLDERAGQRRRVEARLAQRRPRSMILMPAMKSIVRTRDARQLVVDPRHGDLGKARHVVREPLRVVRLVRVVELLAGRRRRTRSTIARSADLAGDGEPALGDRGELRDDAEVGLGLGDDLRPLDLDRDDRPVVERRPVDLGRRRGRERDSVSIVANSSSGSRPSSSRMTVRASSHGNGAASLWSFDSSATRSAGRTSPRLAIIWPIFT